MINSRRNPRVAFTLVELLAVIVLMTVLSAMLAYAFASARQEGNVKRAQAEVRMIGQILQTKVNEIALSRLQLRYATPNNPTPLSAAAAPNEAAERSRAIMLARRDLARLVLPECRADLIYPPANIQFRTQLRNTTTTWVANSAKVAIPSEWNRMRSLIGLRSAAEADNYLQTTASVSIAPTESPGLDAMELYVTNTIYKDALDTVASGTQIDWTREHESAECLYLILASTDLFGETAIDKLHPRSIANLDGDAIPEIVDPWGNPYQFLRHPVGLQSPVIKNFNANAAPAAQYPIDPDPFDFLVSDWRYDTGVNPSSTAPPNQRFFPIYLPPAVISAGKDGEFDLRLTYYTDDSSPAAQNGVNDLYSSSAITWNNPGGLAPLYLNGSATLPYRYPDPFYNVSAIPFGAVQAYEITNANLGQVDLAKRGGGLGGFVDNDGADASADNISSLDGGF